MKKKDLLCLKNQWAIFTALNGSDAESAKRHENLCQNEKYICTLLQDIGQKVELLSFLDKYVGKSSKPYLLLDILFETDAGTAMKRAYFKPTENRKLKPN